MPGLVIIDDTDGRDCAVDCEHGVASVFDTGPTWTEEQLVAFTELVLAARARCQCFGERVWLPPKPPDHLTIDCRLYEVATVDPDIDTVRPVAIPGRAVSAAAARVFETCIPDDHPLEQDWRLVRLWYRQRQLGLLADD